MMQAKIIQRLKRLWAAIWSKLGGAPRVERVGRLNGSLYCLSSPEWEGRPNDLRGAEELLGEARAKFQGGELFRPLTPIADAGGMVIALISENGGESRNHLLAVCPTGMERAGTSPFPFAEDADFQARGRGWPAGRAAPPLEDASPERQADAEPGDGRRLRRS